jgi:hypothetical protein
MRASGDRLELFSPIPLGRRALLAGLSLVPLLAPYEFIIRVRWADVTHPFFWLAAVISLGALVVSGFLVLAALAGLESRMVFDRNQRRFTYSESAPILRSRSWDFPISAIEQVESATHKWSDGAPEYSLRVVMTGGVQFTSGSSWSREEIEHIRARVRSFLGIA